MVNVVFPQETKNRHPQTLAPSPEPTSTPEQQQTEPFLTAIVAAASLAIGPVVGAGLRVYLKKRNR